MSKLQLVLKPTACHIDTPIQLNLLNILLENQFGITGLALSAVSYLKEHSVFPRIRVHPYFLRFHLLAKLYTVMELNFYHYTDDTQLYVPVKADAHS